MMQSARVKVTPTAQEYVYSDKEVLGLEWNGREIRNGEPPDPMRRIQQKNTHCYVTTALQTARSLAEFQAEKKRQDTITIKKEHLKQVVQLSAEFKRYIASMHGNKTDAQIAKREGLRNDSYGDPPRKQQKKMFKDHYDPDEADDLLTSKARAKVSKKSLVDVDYEEEERGKSFQKRSVKKASKPVEEEENSEEEAIPPQSKRRTKAAPYSDEGDERPNGYTKTKASSKREEDNELRRSNSMRPTQLERRGSRIPSKARYDEEEDSDARAPRRKTRNIDKQVSEDDEEEE